MTDNPYDALPTDPVDSASLSAPRSPWGCILASLGIGGVLFVLLLLPAVRRSPEAAYRTSCKNNLKQIMLAIHNYHDDNGAFPPAYTTDTNGNRLHSWRTLILPYLEQKALYRSIDLSKPWNHPANAMAYQTNIETFQCRSSDLDACLTTYHGLIGDEAFLHPTTVRQFDDIGDGTSNTLGIVEVLPQDAIHWMAPLDRGRERFLSPPESSETPHTGGVQAALCDGSVRFISNQLDEEKRTAVMTIHGGEEVEDL